MYSVAYSTRLRHISVKPGRDVLKKIQDENPFIPLTVESVALHSTEKYVTDTIVNFLKFEIKFAC